MVMNESINLYKKNKNKANSYSEFHIRRKMKRGKNTRLYIHSLPPGIFWKIGTNITLASNSQSMSKSEASSSFN